MMVALFVVAWLACAILSAGWWFAYDQKGFPFSEMDRRTDAGFALLMGLVGGPVAVFVAFLMTGFAAHGWMAPWHRVTKG